MANGHHSKKKSEAKINMKSVGKQLRCLPSIRYRTHRKCPFNDPIQSFALSALEKQDYGYYYGVDKPYRT